MSLTTTSLPRYTSRDITYRMVSLNGESNSNNTHPWYSHYNAFDGSPISYWESGSPCYSNNPIYLQYSWSIESFKVIRYRLYVEASNRPIDWKFQGSNDQIIWDDLDIQIAQTGDRLEWISYDISNTEYYSSYRLLCYVGATQDYPIKIYEMELWANVDSITTTTSTTSSSSSSSSTVTIPTTTLTTRTTSTTQSTTATTITGPSLSISTTAPPDAARLWPAEEELSIVRDNFNQWYRTGIPLGIKQVESLPVWSAEYVPSIVYSISSNKYYGAKDTGWEEISLGTILHARSHLSGMEDELIHIGPDAPSEEFTGKFWLDVPETLTTTLTTTTSTTTATQTLSTLSSTVTTAIPSTTITYTTTTLTTSTQTSTTTIIPSAVNVAVGGHVTADSWEIGYEPSKAFDEVINTQWLTNFYQDYFPHWIKYSLVTGAAVHTYSIVWDASRYAYSWYLEGSNNSYVWDTLDFVQSYSFLPGVNYFHFSNSSIYKYYRFRFMDGVDTRHSSIGIYTIGLYAGGITSTSTTTQSSTTQSSTTLTSTTLTTISSSTELIYGLLSSGGIAVANDQYLSYPASNAFDSSNTTYWICDALSGPPYWIMYYWVTGSYIVNKYVLHISTPGRPKSWKFQGSSDGIVWTDLDIQSGITDVGDLEFIFNNSDFYSYYRLYITETNSSGYAVRVGNIELYGYRSIISTSTTTATTTATTTLTTTTTATTTETTASTTIYVPLTQLFLMNFNGTDDSIQSTDDTQSHTSLVWIGDAKIKTDKAKFGSSSLYIPSSSYYPSSGTESYITAPASYDWRLGGGRGNFSIDYWMYIEQYQYLWKNWNTIVSCVESISTYWALRYYPEGQLVNFSLRVDNTLLVNLTSIVNWSYGQWNHIALTRVGNTFKFYHNGTAPDSGEVFDIEVPEIDGSLLIGKGPSEYLNTMLDMNQATYWLDSLRIYLGSLYSEDFTVPSQPTTSTTASTSTTSTTSYLARNYTVKLSLPCNDGGSDVYDTSGRHGIANVPSSSVFTPQFQVTEDQAIDPLFGTVFLSSQKYPMDLTNSEGSYIVFDNHSDWRLSGSNDFTIEAWLAYKNTQYRYESPILSYYQDESNFWFININCYQQKFFYKLVSAGSLLVSYSATINLQSLSWNYFAFVRNQRRYRLFWNGHACGDWSFVDTSVIPSLATGVLLVFGGPSASDYTTVMSSGIASNGLRISEGIVDGVMDGSIPIYQF